MVDRAPKRAISKNSESVDVRDNCSVELSIATTGILEVFLVEAEGLKADPLLRVFIHDMWGDHWFPHSFCGFGPVAFGPLDD